MKFIIFFIYIPFVYSELHKFYTKYAEIKGQTLAGIPEIFSVTTLDGRQIDYYDSEIKKLIPRQDWTKEFASGDKWKEYTKFRNHMQQIYKNNFQVLMQQLHQSDGVHTYQRMYGCEWDDQTEDSNGFEQHGYDGEDFITLDMENSRYNTSLQQAAKSIVEKWNNDRKQLESLKNYHKHDCVYWLMEFIKAALTTTEHPKVSLLQKTPEHYVLCHVTGFHSRNTTILWWKNGHAISNSSDLVMIGDLLPNEDETFQRTLTLYVSPKYWKKDQYVCVVEQNSLTEPIQKTLTEDEIKRNKKSTSLVLLIVVSVISIPLALSLLWKCWSKLKTRYKKLCTTKSIV